MSDEPTSSNYDLRIFRPQDENFVVRTWLDSYAKSQYGRRFGANVGKHSATYDTIWKKHRSIVLALINDPAVRIDVLCDVEEPDQIYGWSCTEPGVLHYAIVKYSAIAAGFGVDMLRALFGARVHESLFLSHEPAWARHVRETRPTNPGSVAKTDSGQPLPYYYQSSSVFFALPQSWKLDENYLARKWCPVRAA